MGYFFDSYALIEMFKFTPHFEKFADEPITMTLLNLIEVTQFFHNSQGKERAKKVTELLRGDVVEVSNNDILKAVEFRALHKKKNVSFADSLGYIYALNHGLKFLTGDDAFKGMPNVEFVK